MLLANSPCKPTVLYSTVGTVSVDLPARHIHVRVERDDLFRFQKRILRMVGNSIIFMARLESCVDNRWSTSFH